MCAVSVLEKQFSWTHSAWAPTEPIATRPLFTQRGTGYKFFYICDGNKNVSELVHFEQRNGIAAHYDYAPFGAVTRAISASAVTDNTFTTDNPFRFSSEYHEDTLGLVYYNYRHYSPIDGRWLCKDFITKTDYNPYLYLDNALFINFDILGLDRRLIYWSAKRFYMTIHNEMANSHLPFTSWTGEILAPWLHAEISVDLWSCLDGKMVKVGETRYGFKAIGPNVFSTQGVVFEVDDTHETILENTQSSTPCEDMALYDELKRLEMNPPQYKFIGYNCYDFAIEMFYYGLGEY